jgi:hypothetical protein
MPGEIEVEIQPVVEPRHRQAEDQREQRSSNSDRRRKAHVASVV